MPKILLEKLQTLQCHFTWDIELGSPEEINTLLRFLTQKWKHTPYGNRSLYLALKAFLYCQQKCYAEALGSLLAAEVIVMEDRPDNVSLHNLVTYGNYAWIYYHLSNFPKVESYLFRIQSVCQSLDSPQPYSVTTPKIMAQKGWSLLARGVQTREAIKCFQIALRDDQSNEEFKGGLATSLYASWDSFQIAEHRDMAKELLEEIIQIQPQNYEARLYLAYLLLGLDEERAIEYVEDVVQNSLSPDILRKSAVVCIRAKPQRLHQAIAILKKAIGLEPSYNLLYYDLGICYKHHLMGQVPPEERAVILEAAVENLQRAAEIDYLFVFPMLELARIYGETTMDYEEEIYLNLMEELPSVSKLSQQVIHIFFGDFLLKKAQKHQALEMFLAGLRISGGRLEERNVLKTRLMMLAQEFQKDCDTDQVDTIHRFLQSMQEEVEHSHTGDV